MDAMNVAERYDLDALVGLIARYGFKRVVLQFPDEELEHCVLVNDYLTEALRLPQNVDKDGEVDFYVAADSTWGSSIDDVSAMHCDGDLLVYFGTDLSSSGSIPVVVVPPRKFIDTNHCVEQLFSSTQEIIHASNADVNCNACGVVIFFEPVFNSSCQIIASQLQQKYNMASSGPKVSVQLATLPLHADVNKWEPQIGTRKTIAGATATFTSTTTSTSTPSSASSSEVVVVGGLHAPAYLLQDKEAVVVYIGDKPEQIVNILLRVSENTVLHYSTNTSTSTSADANANSYATGTNVVRVLKGTESREFRERYGGVLRVKDAHIVGIIVGSMGLTGELTKDIVHRLETLITAAHKKFYCFVMGRLNEAKLCNFPEVCFYCWCCVFGAEY